MNEENKDILKENELVNEINNLDENPEKTEDNSINYKMLVSSIKELGEHYKILKSFTIDNLLRPVGLRESILYGILPYEKDSIDEVPVDEFRTLLSKHTFNPEKYNDQFKVEMSDEEIINLIKEIKNSSLSLLSAKSRSNEIKKDASEIFEEQLKYLASEKAQEERKSRLEHMKELCKSETDPIKEKEMKKMIETTESSLSFSFLLDRIKKYGEEEIISIKDSYFTKNRNSYLITKYTNKIKKFGYNPLIYKHFFNIEENFLDLDKYGVFNNLFLFIYMRMVAHSNPSSKYDKLLIRSVTDAMANLVYHRFSNESSELLFIKTIENVLDNFMEYKEEFNEKNILHPYHPERIAKDKESEKRRYRELLVEIENLKLNISDPESMSIDELNKEVDKQIKEMIDRQVEKFDKENENENNDEDTINLNDINLVSKENKEPEVLDEDSKLITIESEE